MRELVRALAKVVLLYAPQMRGEASAAGGAPLSSWGLAWRGILDCLVAAMTQVRAWVRACVHMMNGQCLACLVGSDHAGACARSLGGTPRATKLVMATWHGCARVHKHRRCPQGRAREALVDDGGGNGAQTGGRCTDRGLVHRQGGRCTDRGTMFTSAGLMQADAGKERYKGGRGWRPPWQGCAWGYMCWRAWG